MVELRRWTDDDEPLLHATVGDPEMMEYLGGPESPELIARRHARLRDWSADGGAYTIRIPGVAMPVGTIGLWDSAWAGDDVFETGWMVLPAYARRGIATEAAREIVALACALRKHRFLVAFPAVDNIASNRVCEGAGFTNLGAYEIEYPPGRAMRAHAWRVDLVEVRSRRAAQAKTASISSVRSGASAMRSQS